MQEKISATIPKGENIITIQDIEEEGIVVRKMWHSDARLSLQYPHYANKIACHWSQALIT